jgi:hypothetical protein
MKPSLADQLGYVKPEEVAVAAFSLLEVLQNLPAAYQIQSVAAIYLQMCVVLDADVSAELERSERIMHDADRMYVPHFKAINDYIKGEIRGKY